MVEGALEVVVDALRSYEMGLIGVVYVEAHVLDCVDVRPGEGEVLESLGQAAIGGWVAHRGAHVRGDL
jgi:hypothetical protein